MKKKQAKKSNENVTLLLWAGVGFLALALLFARAIYPELIWLTVLVALPLVGVLGALISQNQKALKSRKAAYGLNSTITILLVIAIVSVLNFIVARYPLKLDLTKNKLHTLSDQTSKLIKGLQKPVKATLYAKMQQKEQFHSLLDNYKALNPKFEVEYVDPDREPARSRQAGIKKYGTLQLTVGTRDNKIEEPTEEKLTNTLIKLMKEKTPTLCSTIGHGEKSFSSPDSEGLENVKKALGSQSYEVKEINLAQEGKISDSCDAITIMGPTKSFFAPEIQAVRDYLNAGGHAVIAVDINLKGGETNPELISLLQEWHVKAVPALVVDPLSRLFGVDSSVAVLANYSKESPITKDFQVNCALPFTRPLDPIPGAPAGMNVQWIAQTTPKSWGVMDLKQIAKGEVKFEQGKDRMGPLTAAISVEGKQKDSKATKNTRLVVFGSSHFATNNFSRMGGNLDFFMNAVSWAMEDESLISIRAKEEGPGKIELSQKSGTFIFLMTVIVIPLVVAAAGIGIWMVRRRL